jgi:NADH dehydrogenase [ubiquinone] 1 alpha subcomplex assembly factor 7
MNSLTKLIHDIIKDKNFISIKHFINLALYHPTLGYYQKKNPFGMGGDFVTAPQISSLFNELISLFFIYQFKKNWKEGMKVYFIELGPGNGFFIKDFLTLASKIENLKNNLEVILVEISENLQAEQKKYITELKTDIPVSWHTNTLEALNTITDSDDNLIFTFSNEFFDAFPINQYIKYQNKWHEVCIVKNEKEDEKLEFGFTHFDYRTAIRNHLQLLGYDEENINDGEIIEISNDVIEIFYELSKKIKRNKGTILTIDYGYLQTQFSSSLQSLKNHQYNNVLDNIGEADITYLVNFELLFNIAVDVKLHAFPPITQKDFLTSIGIIEKLNLLFNKTTDEVKKHLLKTSTDRLISEAQMGSLFKVFICENY